MKGIKVSIIGGEGYELGYVSTTDDKGNYQLYVRDAGNYFINATGYAGKYKDYVSKSSNFEIQEAIHEYTFNFIINPCAYIIGSYTFSGAGTNSVFTFKDSLGNEYKIDELTADSYTVRVPINTEGQIIGEPINHSAQPYKTLTYNITTPGAGESVTRDFYFYKDAEMCNVGGSLSYTDDSPTYQLEYYSEETQTSISQPYSGSPCQISFSVPPKSDGILKIVAGNNQTFLYDLQSGDPSSSISLGDIDFDQADAGHIDVEVKHGTFNDSLLPSGWTKLSSTKWTTEMYTKGSTVDLCLKGIEEAVLPEANYYFQYIDKSYQDATLGNALTASFVCDWYLCAPEKVYGKKD